VAILSILLLTYINTNGIESGKKVQLFFTAAKLFALFALIIMGLYIGLESNVLSENFENPWVAFRTVINEDKTISFTELSGLALVGAIGATIINSLFSSDAWNNVTFIAAEIKDPKKNIPRSLFLGTLIVTIVYILANLAYLSLLPVLGDPNGTTDLIFTISPTATSNPVAVNVVDSPSHSEESPIMVSIPVGPTSLNNISIVSVHWLFATQPCC
jgi:APA family basic amino acid/polyamine antiporter